MRRPLRTRAVALVLCFAPVLLATGHVVATVPAVVAGEALVADSSPAANADRASPAEEPRPGMTAQATAEQLEHFERVIRPLLARRCFECHSAASDPVQGGLRLDTPAAIVAGGDSGSLFEPGAPLEGLLAAAVRYDSELVQMPPEGKLPAAEVQVLLDWIGSGAPLPRPQHDDAIVARSGIDWEAGRQHWAFRPLARSAPAQAPDDVWSQTWVDRFVLAELRAHQLEPSPEAGRSTLIRRVTFDLIGLPPTPEEVADFVADDDPSAYERLVERLLASPHYGERWGRYWLDLARYADQTARWVPNIKQAWRYRDWVVQAFNDDVPYERFVRLQLAADRVADARLEDQAALGLLALSPVYWKELRLDPEVIKGIVADEWEERIDAVGRTFLGLTISCARCHDHKYDPISTQDYYGLAGVFASTRQVDRPLLPESDALRVQAVLLEIESLRKQISDVAIAKTTGKLAADLADREREDLESRVAQLRRETPGIDAPLVHVVDDAAIEILPKGRDATRIVFRPGEAHDLALHIRGNPSNPGAIEPRHFLRVFSEGPPRPLTTGSGRLDLAEALLDEAQPLTARVIVNRVWEWHFGQGLVDTPSDFGRQGSLPTHPTLLDELAARFVEHGWSLKWLHRELMVSATYRQSWRSNPAGQALDPDNRWLWRAPRRRLDVEAWRDAMLAATGTLDRSLGGPAVQLDDARNRRRTLYAFVDREEVAAMLRLHDFPDPNSHSPQRQPTTTPLQQLFVLNGPLLTTQGQALAERLAAEGGASVSQRVQHAYWLLFARAPQPDELALAEAFLGPAGDSEAATAERWAHYCQALLASNEFMYID